jgi:hypothetical protein
MRRLIRDWLERAGVGSDALPSALLDLRQRGNYLPGKSHPLKPWWDSVVAETVTAGDDF